MAKQFRRLNGDTPEALEALSWVARGQLAAGRVDEAIQQAEDIERSSQAAWEHEPWIPSRICRWLWAQPTKCRLKRFIRNTNFPKPFNSYSRLYESPQHVARREATEEHQFDDTRGQTYAAASHHRVDRREGQRRRLAGQSITSALLGALVCRLQNPRPVIAKLAAEFGSKGLVVVAPTERYGYTMDDDQAPPAKETAFIQKVFERYYSSIPNVRVPLDAANFEHFGASTTPTIVLVDRRGIVKLYHPGLMDEASLLSALQPLLR